MAKIINNLKKIEVGNPLYNLGLYKLLDEYEDTKTDEELAAFFHKLLSAVEGSQVAEKFTYAMIAFATGKEVNEKLLLHEVFNRI